MRGPGYDNGSNMAGIYNGVQALILKQNAAALYLPCAAHSLNLVGVHAASVNSTMVPFFLVQLKNCLCSSHPQLPDGRS